MTKNQLRLEKEAVLIGLAIVIMTIKIAIGLLLYSRWQQKQAAAGHPIGRDDEGE